MAFDFATVFVFALIAVGFLFGGLMMGSFIRPNVPDPEKATIYECGERPIGPAWFKFNPRFYLIALVFVIFDVEVAFMFPVVSVYQEWIAQGFGLVAFLEILAFVGILSVALAYVWVSGDLAWVKKTLADRHSPATPEFPESSSDAADQARAA